MTVLYSIMYMNNGQCRTGQWAWNSSGMLSQFTIHIFFFLAFKQAKPSTILSVSTKRASWFSIEITASPDNRS